jgi:hypothetical protein
MASICSGSWIVLAATRAKDSDAGFLRFREGSRYVLLNTGSQENFLIHVRPNIDHETGWPRDVLNMLVMDRLVNRTWCY